MADSEYHQEHVRETKNIILNTTSQTLIFFGLVSVILFSTLFSTYPPLHDFFHGMRHALMIIPCH